MTEDSGPFRKVVDLSRTYLPVTVSMTLIIGTVGILWTGLSMKSDIDTRFVTIDARMESVEGSMLQMAQDVTQLTDFARDVIEGRLDTLERRQDTVIERIAGHGIRLERLEQ